MPKPFTSARASRTRSLPSAARGYISGHSARLVDSLVETYLATPTERVRIVNAGVPANAVALLAKRMAMPQEKLIEALGFSRDAIRRKVREKKRLSVDESSLVLGLACLIGQVQAMVEESGDPEGFNAAMWVARWLEQSLPAIGGLRPAELMDTVDGQALISNVVARMQSGAYS